MEQDKGEYVRRAREFADGKIVEVADRIDELKGKLFNMELPPQMEAVLRNRIRTISILGGLLALVALFYMVHSPLYLKTSLLVGLIAAILDYIVEYNGIKISSWNYPNQHISFRRVPVEVPLLFFSCGILATFILYCASLPRIASLVYAPAVAGISFLQIALVVTGIFFMIQYFRRAVSSLVFGMLPIAIAMYLAFPEPWVLVVSIIPMYVDYYLEKRLVKSAHIEYDRYSEEVATNVAIAYFPSTLLIMGIAAILCYLLS